MSTPTFSISNGIIRSREQSQNSPSIRPSSSSIQERNKQLILMKEQFLALKQQYKEDQIKDNEKIMALERQLRAEMKKTEELERRLAELKSKSCCSKTKGSVRVVERIWDIMTTYREQIRNGALNPSKQQNKNDEKRVSFK